MPSRSQVNEFRRVCSVRTQGAFDKLRTEGDGVVGLSCTMNSFRDPLWWQVVQATHPVPSRPMFASLFLRRRTLGRIVILTVSIFLFRHLFGPKTKKHEIQTHNVLERVTRTDKMLDVSRHDFLQVRMGRDERDGMLSDMVQDGVQDYWERFQFPL